MSKCRKAELDEDSLGHISSLKDMARELGSQEFQKRVDNLCQQMEMIVQDNQMRRKSTAAGAWVVHTGKKPLSVYDAEMWQKAFPLLFPYGDGVFGLPRRRHMTFQQWASYMLTRTELSYTCSDSESSGVSQHSPFLPPSQPRRSSDQTFYVPFGIVRGAWRS